jgi:hypothetical protein
MTYYQQSIDMWWAASRIKYGAWTGPAASVTPSGFRIDPGWVVGNGSMNDVQTLELSAYFFLDTARMPAGALSFLYGYPWPAEGPKMSTAFSLSMRANDILPPWFGVPASAAGSWEAETTFQNGVHSGGSVWRGGTATATASTPNTGMSMSNFVFPPYATSVNEGLDAALTLNVAVTIRFRLVLQGLLAMVGFNTSSGVPIDISIPPFTVLVRDFISYT